jgi:hypothetical protein
LTRPELPEAALNVAIDTVDKLTAELNQVRAKRAEQLPADRERVVREQLDWLAKHAVSLQAITFTGDTTYTADDASSLPYTGFNVLGASKGSKVQTGHNTGERQHYDADRLRMLCADMGLRVSVRWTGMPGQRGRMASASFTAGCRKQGSPART